MVVAQMGPLTSLAESAAAAVGACMLLGSFAVGARRSFVDRRRKDFENHALLGGYIGGLFGIGFMVADIIIRYAF